MGAPLNPSSPSPVRDGLLKTGNPTQNAPGQEKEEKNAAGRDSPEQLEGVVEGLQALLGVVISRVVDPTIRL